MFESQYIDSLKKFKPVKKDKSERILGSFRKNSRISVMSQNSTKSKRISHISNISHQ